MDASFGLGEALVSGLVNPDVFTVRDGRSSPVRSPPNDVPLPQCRVAGRGRWTSTRSGRSSRR
ncbi:hypothetical protein NKG94_07380 [Micromonospora sp. M12]